MRSEEEIRKLLQSLIKVHTNLKLSTRTRRDAYIQIQILKEILNDSED